VAGGHQGIANRVDTGCIVTIVVGQQDMEPLRLHSLCLDSHHGRAQRDADSRDKHGTAQ
jgi:hypothetical protein